MARVVAVLACGVVALSASPASATTNGIRLFISAPFVQATSYSGLDVLVENFNGYSTGTGQCLGTSTVGEITNTCLIRAGDGAGGASTTSDTPTAGGSWTNYAATPWPSGGAEIEITFEEPAQYIGLWWSAGNVAVDPANTNNIKFYNGEDLLVTMTADEVMELLGGSVPNPYPGAAVLTSEGGTDYPIGFYYGAPVGHTSTSPSAKSTFTGDYPFVFLNLFTEGATRVDRVVIAGWGFEFDNFTVSAMGKVPTNDMVFVAEYLDEVTDSSGGDGGGTDSGGDGSGSGGESSTLAATGADPVPLGILGAAILLAGITFLAARRIRRRT